MRLYNSEKLCLSISIECPWVIIESEETMSIKYSIMLFGWSPFLIKDGGLLTKINIIVKCIVIEVWIRQFVILWLSVVRLIENVHDLNNLLHHILLEDLLHDYDSDVKLKSLDYLAELILWHTIHNQISWEIDKLFWTLGSKVCMTSLGEFNNALEDTIEGEYFHFRC